MIFISRRAVGGGRARHSNMLICTRPRGRCLVGVKIVGCVGGALGESQRKDNSGRFNAAGCLVELSRGEGNETFLIHSPP